MLTYIIIIVGFIVLYYIIKFKSTQYKYEEVFILRDEFGKPRINILGNIPGLNGDKIYIRRKDKYVFNKLVSSKFEIIQANYLDDDDYWM